MAAASTAIDAAAAAPKEPPDEYISIAQLRFAAVKGKDPAAAQAKLLALIKKREMGPLYSAVCEQLGTAPDAALVSSLAAANAAELAKIDETIARCDKDEGESEVREAYLARSDFYVRIGENAKAHTAIEETYTKTVAIGLRLDLLLCKLRVGFFFDDLKLVKATVDRAKALLETGGDWERRNRLKVYEAVFLMSIRDLKKSSALFLDSIATFTATELISYNTFILYAVSTSLVALPRSEIKPKIIDAPEILQVIQEIPHLAGLVNGLYGCSYRLLFVSLVEVIETLKADRYFAQHARHYWRETRVLAYTQFLESYRSVSLQSMAASFGVSAAFLDSELAAFISAGRLSCSIDKVGGIVSSTRPDTKNAQYQAVIKSGDLLLNRVQRLSRVVNL